MIMTTNRTRTDDAAGHFDGNLDQMRLLDLYDAMSAATGGLDLSIEPEAIERLLDAPQIED